ncbi:hypothetical protein BCR42DRAFT_435617 [Absidia repens]|uniref:Uncharacterized protein n=1 Tax=Absidia repens TaxID=90262 RepID=A0A1X2IP30_9FUNG|nr:hypothetical protein BCR42DRAFT_435617 [Absidia repens]
MSRETKRPHYYYTDPEFPPLTGSDATKRTKTQHTTTPELSLATLSINEVTTTPSTTVATTTRNYASINQYLRQIHIERFGDPELRERWWERYGDNDKEQTDKEDNATAMMDITDE